MTKRIQSTISCLLCLATMFLMITCGFSASAATFDELNQPGVFCKQSVSNGPCILASCVMMIRRTLIGVGDTNWKSVTESSLKSVACSSGYTMKHNFEYRGVSVGHGTFDQSSSTLRSLLAQHPEGVVLFSANRGHAVLVTDYTNGSFYAADPLNSPEVGRIPFSQVHKVTVSNASAYWYVTSPKVTLSGASAAAVPGAVTDLSSDKTAYSTADSITVSWNAVAGATDYLLSFWKDGTKVSETHCAKTTFTQSPLSAGGYSVRVFPGNAAGYQTESPVCSFTVQGSVRLTYNANGGAGEPSGQTGFGRIKLSDLKPVRSGFSFLGWAKTADAVLPQYSAGGNFELTGDATLYAVWRKESAEGEHRPVELSDFTVTYKAKAQAKPVIDESVGAGYTVVYSSSDPEVATVNEKGEVTGVSCGTAIITCTVTAANGTVLADACTVTVRYSLFQWILRFMMMGLELIMKLIEK